MQPDRYYREEILMNNYGEMARNHENKADYVILVTELDYKHLEQFKESGRHYFLYHDDIHISESQVFNKPKCERPSNSIATDTMVNISDLVLFTLIFLVLQTEALAPPPINLSIDVDRSISGLHCSCRPDAWLYFQNLPANFRCTCDPI